MNLKISVWCNQFANRVMVAPLIKTVKATTQTSFYMVNNVWYSKLSGTLKPDDVDMSPEEWMHKMHAVSAEMIEELVGYSCAEIVNGEAVYFFPDRSSAIEFTDSLSTEAEIVWIG